MYSQKKRQTSYYNQKQGYKKKRNFTLEPGLKGFICTCNFREKDCVKEAYNILNEYADELYGSKDKQSKEGKKTDAETTESTPSTCDKGGEKEEEEIDTALAKELHTLKEDWRKPQRFQVVESGANNCLFIKTTLPDPTELAHHIMNDIFNTKKQKSRYLLRLVPIEVTCKAYMDEIQKNAAVLFDKYFSKEGKTYAVVFNYRNNSSISRTSVIEEFAEMIKLRNVNNKVDLSQPELTVIVEVIRSMCCMSVVPDYFKLLKYNLLELCGKGEKAKIKAKAEGEGETATAEGKEGGTGDGEEAKSETAETEGSSETLDDNTEDKLSEETGEEEGTGEEQKNVDSQKIEKVVEENGAENTSAVEADGKTPPAEMENLAGGDQASV